MNSKTIVKCYLKVQRPTTYFLFIIGLNYHNLNSKYFNGSQINFTKTKDGSRRKDFQETLRCKIVLPGLNGKSWNYPLTVGVIGSKVS